MATRITAKVANGQSSQLINVDTSGHAAHIDSLTHTHMNMNLNSLNNKKYIRPVCHIVEISAHRTKRKNIPKIKCAHFLHRP